MQRPSLDPSREIISGQAAVTGLSKLITEAVRQSNDALVGELDRILRDVEHLMESAHGDRGRRSDGPHGVHEKQARY